MERRVLLGVVLVAIVGVLLLDKGVTGLVVADVGESQLENAASHFNFLLGCVMILTAVYSTAWLAARRPNL